MRVDAGSVRGLSFGHLSRCLVLARALKKKTHAKIRFIMRDYPEGIEYAIKNGMTVETIPLELSPAEHDALWLQKTEKFNPDWTFIDLPYPDNFSKICSRLKEVGSKILFIDDTRFKSPHVDTFLNSNILALKKNIIKHPGTKYLLGPEFFIFNPSGRAKVTISSPSEKINVVLSFGGSDPSGLGFNVEKALKTNVTQKKISLSIILGPGFKQKHKKKTRQLKHQSTTKVVDAPMNIYSHFLNSDLVICAGGRTLYELYMLNIPAFPIASIEHEKPVVRAFIKNNMVKTGLTNWDKKKFLIKFNWLLKELYP